MCQYVSGGQIDTSEDLKTCKIAYVVTTFSMPKKYIYTIINLKRLYQKQKLGQKNIVQDDWGCDQERSDHDYCIHLLFINTVINNYISTKAQTFYTNILLEVNCYFD